MRSPLLVALAVVTSALVAGCMPDQAPVQETESPSTQQTSAQPPPAPKPAADGPCPYLDTDEVERANGQGVGEVRVSAGEQQHPTCFFYRPDGDLQLTVRVYVGQPDIAIAIVDEAAPIDTSNPAEEPSGWAGGYESTDDSSVYAVAKGGKAIVVTTNQGQSVKARKVATDAIAALGL